LFCMHNLTRLLLEVSDLIIKQFSHIMRPFIWYGRCAESL